MSATVYHDLFRLRAIRAQAIGGLLAQITQGAAGVGIILVVRAGTGSLALAGVVVGALSIAAAVGRPLQGRVIDRRNPRLLMVLCGLIHAAALVAIAALAGVHVPGSVLIALGVIAGGALPPISTSMRVTWGIALPESDRTAAYSLVYLTQELSILIGPLLLAGVIAAANASLALIVVAVIAGAGTIGFAATLAPEPAHRSAATAGDPVGVLQRHAMLLLIGVAALMGAVFGALEVGVPTLATAHHAPAASGVLIASLSVGGIIGAVLYGARRWESAAQRRLLALLAALTAAVSLMFAVGSLVALGALLLLAGIALNPALTTVSVLVDLHVARASAAEAFGWLSTGFASGTGAANAVAGAVAHGAGAQSAFLLAAGAGAAATLLTAVARHALRRPTRGKSAVRPESA